MGFQTVSPIAFKTKLGEKGIKYAFLLKAENLLRGFETIFL
jgi:hypothetical protein